MSWDDLVAEARRGRGPLRHARSVWRSLIAFRIPVFRPLAAILYAERDLRRWIWPLLAKIFYREPLLRYRAAYVGRSLTLEGTLPEITGSGSIHIGDNVTIGGYNTWVVGFKVSDDASLIIEDRVYVGYHVTLSVAQRVFIGADTMLAARVQVFDNVSHPLSPERRRRHDHFTLEETAPVEIGRNCWIGTGVIIMRGVTIGENSVVAAMSVVTRDIPSNVLAGGNPARVIRGIADAPPTGTDVATPPPVGDGTDDGSASHSVG